MKIKDLCSYAPKSRIKAGEAVENAKYLFFTSSADENKRYTDFQFDKEAIIMGTGGNATLHYYNGKFSVSTDCLVLFPNSKIKCKYLYYFFKSHMSVLEAGFKGAGLKHTNKKYIEEINVSKVPDLTTQEKIVSHLDTITENIEKLNRELELFGSLTKARFIEMFGDPVADTRNWGQTLLKEHLESIKYGTSTPPIFTDDGYAFIRATNIKNGKIVTNDMKYIPQEEADRLEKCKLSGGEIIIVRSGVNAGDTCIVTDEYIGQYAGYDMILVLSSDLHPVFFNTLINTEYMDKVVKPLTRRAAQPHLNSEQTQRLPIIEVPFELQEQFADFVKQVDKSREEVKKSLEKTQQLYDSLMQEYFG